MSDAVKFGPKAAFASVPECSTKNLQPVRDDHIDRSRLPYSHAPITLPARKESDNDH
jgi:hypothetical protein